MPCPALARHPAIHDGDSCVTCGWRPDRRAEALLTKLSATEQMMADSAKEIACWKDRALKAESELDALEPCDDPSCGTPCNECWKKGKGRPVHPSNMPSIVDLLEDRVAKHEQSEAQAWSKYRVLKSMVRALLAAEERGQGVSWQEAIKRLAMLVNAPPKTDEDEPFNRAPCTACGCLWESHPRTVCPIYQAPVPRARSTGEGR